MIIQSSRRQLLMCWFKALFLTSKYWSINDLMVLILVENTHSSNTFFLCNLSYIRILSMECQFTISCTLPVYLLSAYPVDDSVYNPFMFIFYLHYCGALVLNISYKSVVSLLPNNCLTFIPQVEAFSLALTMSDSVLVPCKCAMIQILTTVCLGFYPR